MTGTALDGAGGPSATAGSEAGRAPGGRTGPRPAANDTGAPGAAVAAGKRAERAAERAGRHLHYVDMVRVLTVALVIGVHVLGAGPLPQTEPVGAVETVLHVSREVFFLLTAFVLTYSSGRPGRAGTRHWLRFWRRRYLFVGVPYLAWSLIYFLALGHPVTPFGRQLGLLTHQVLTGTARYHLYFLLVSMQIYLAFPALLALIRATARRPWPLLAGAAGYQLLVSWAVQDHWHAGVLTGWLNGPDAWLPSYLGYVLAGAVAGWHREALVRWTRAHPRTVAAATAGAVALGVAVYLLHTLGEGVAPVTGAEVFQPVVVVESAAIAWAFLAAGLRWEDRGLPGRRAIRAASDASFGVYLSHPLLLQGLFAASAAVGLTARARSLGGPLPTLVQLLVVVPLVYAAAVLGSAVFRRTVLSLPLTGRSRLRRAPRPAPASQPTPPTGGS